MRSTHGSDLTGLAERRRTELNKMLGELKEAEASAEVLAEQYNELLTVPKQR